jgi:hypothetical protein
MGLLAVMSVALLVYLVTVLIYRAFFHPLLHVPGPLLSINYLSVPIQVQPLE